MTIFALNNYFSGLCEAVLEQTGPRLRTPFCPCWCLMVPASSLPPPSHVAWEMQFGGRNPILGYFNIFPCACARIGTNMSCLVGNQSLQRNNIPNLVGNMSLQRNNIPNLVGNMSLQKYNISYLLYIVGNKS